MAETEYKPTGFFANRQVGTFARFIKDGKLDADAAKQEFLLNDAQIPQLEVELQAAGFLPKADESAAAADKRDTAPLPPLAETPTAGQVKADTSAPKTKESE